MNAGVASPAAAFVSSARRRSSRPPFTKLIATGALLRADSTKIAGGAVSSSPAPSSASALARRLGASSVSAGGGWDDDGEKENDSVRTFRGEFDGENYLEDAREDRELREVDETVDAALRRMKTKGAFPERLTAEEMRRLVDECRSEQGA